MRKFRVQITFFNEGLEKTVVLRKKFKRLVDGLDYFKKLNPTAGKITTAILLA